MKRHCEACYLEKPITCCGGGAAPSIQLCHECAKAWSLTVLAETVENSGLCPDVCHEAWGRRRALGEPYREADRVARNRRARAARASHDDAMRSIGLVKVRGALGGTYWE